MKKVALLGLGTMGTGMATQLLQAGFALNVYNRTRQKAEALQQQGAFVAEHPAEAAAGADVVISMLADDDASHTLWLGKDGALSGAMPGAILVESGTVTPGWIEELKLATTDRQCKLLDAPVTGSRMQAAAGELTFLVGGNADVLDVARPVLAAMGKKIIHVGPCGSGSRLKLINNFLCAVQLVSLAEAVGWMEHAGIDMEIALDALYTGAPGSPLLKAMSQRMMKHDYEVNFLLKLLGKDVGYARSDANLFGIPLQSAASTAQIIENAKSLGYGDKDMSSVVEQFRK